MCLVYPNALSRSTSIEWRSEILLKSKKELETATVGVGSLDSRATSQSTMVSSPLSSGRLAPPARGAAELSIV